MKRIKWIDQRLEQWAHCRLASPGGYSSPAFEYVEPSTDGRPAFAEISAEMESDAQDMDMAIAALPGDLRSCVVAYYTWGGGMSQITEKLLVTRATVHRRLCHADIRLVAWLDGRKERQAQLQARRLV